MTSVIERLKACESDPMWADHSEISKRTLREVIALLCEKDSEVARIKKASAIAVHSYEQHRTYHEHGCSYMDAPMAVLKTVAGLDAEGEQT